MKRLALFLIIALFTIMLAACGGTETDDDVDDEETAAPTSENKEETSESESQESGSVAEDIPIKEVVDYDFGTLHVIQSSVLENDSEYFQDHHGETLNYYFTSAQVGILDPIEAYEDLFTDVYEYNYEDLGEIVVLIIDFEVENSTDESMTVIEPYAGKAIQRYQSHLNPELSDDLSGEFGPNEIKSGRVLYHLYTPPTDIVERGLFELHFHTSTVADASGNEQEDLVKKVLLWMHE